MENNSIFFKKNINVEQYNNTVGEGGSITVSNNGTLSNNVISGSGVVNVSSGGIAAENIVVSGGLLNISSGGIASANTIENAGSVVVYSGGTMQDALVQSGGSAIISNGGNLTGILTLEKGGYAYITTSTGGTIDLQDPTAVSLLGTQRDYEFTSQQTGLVISGTGSATTVINGFSATDASNSDTITLDNVTLNNITNVAYPDVNHVTFTLKDGTTITLNVTGVGNYGYALTSDANGNLVYEVCF